MGSIDKIVVSCMDRRLSSHLDSTYNDGDTIFVRNAGANIGTALNTVKQLSITHGISDLVIAPHTDCGAMGLVERALGGEIVPSSAIEEGLVKQFRGRSFSDRAELEELNGELQSRAILPFATAIKAGVTVELIDLAKIEVPKHEGAHILTIAHPSERTYSSIISRYSGVGMYDSYFIQATNVRDILPDIEIAVSALKISDVRLMALNRGEDEQLARDMKFLSGSRFMSETKMTLLKASAKRKAGI